MTTRSPTLKFRTSFSSSSITPTPSSVCSRIFGSFTVSSRTSPIPWNTIAFIGASSFAVTVEMGPRRHNGRSLRLARVR